MVGALAAACGSAGAQLFVNAEAGAGGNGQTWDTAFNNLQDAIDAAAPGGEIWVAAGTYKPGAARTDSFTIDKMITILGGFEAGETDRDMRNAFQHVVILSGDINGDDGDDFAGTADNCFHVVQISNSGAVLNGVNIRGGNANGGGAQNNGGGVLLDGVSPMLLACTIAGNQATADGGGIYCTGAASPTLGGCFIEGNIAVRGGGLYLNDLSNAEMTRVSFVQNAADTGGGLYAANSRPVPVSCLFAGNMANDGGGAYLDSASITTLSNCVFSSNVAMRNGGGLFNNGVTDLFNATFEGNTAAESGGGIAANVFDPVPVSAQTATELMGGQGRIDGGTTLTTGNSPLSLSLDDMTPDYPRNLVFFFDAAASMLSVSSVQIVGTNARDEPQTETLSNPALGALVTGTQVFRTIDSITVTYSGESNPSSATAHVGVGASIMSDLPTVTNSILWNNSDAGGDDESAQFHNGGGPAPVSHSCIQELDALAGNGNIDDDPMFLNAAGLDGMPGTGDDIHYPAHESPCIDVGDSNARAIDVSDADGDENDTEPLDVDYDLNPRVLDDPSASDGGVAAGGAVIDMGAFERQGQDCNDSRLQDSEEIALGLPDPCAEPMTNGNTNGDTQMNENAASDNGNGNDNSDTAENGNANANTNGTPSDNANQNGDGGTDAPPAGPCPAAAIVVLGLTLVGLTSFGRRSRRGDR
jgi:predicted outer membrane repeat protein